MTSKPRQEKTKEKNKAAVERCLTYRTAVRDSAVTNFQSGERPSIGFVTSANNADANIGVFFIERISSTATPVAQWWQDVNVEKQTCLWLGLPVDSHQTKLTNMEFYVVNVVQLRKNWSKVNLPIFLSSSKEPLA
ncbi:hypothetical protein CEXT_352971 [Caerostris extrusa]|uniref:Uncharacterized protein n=1 Tax=Caerostris extrusa TaxID=172846 RepID=A0AAV4WBE7_CAEEX|nr:hypothetical protein CEXT_352971 [Caerostris extrusa]